MHKPVLLKEIIEYLNPRANQNFIDCTLGGGGHSLAILKKIEPEGKVLGIDLDKEAIKRLQGIKNLILVQENFANLKLIAEKNNFFPVNPVRKGGSSNSTALSKNKESQGTGLSNGVNGILLDLGLSSDLLEKSGRGFSFLRDEPLDMRFDLNDDLTAEKIINSYEEEELAEIFEKYGEERFSKRIAGKIIESRKTDFIKTTNQLVEVIKKAVPFRFQHSRIHFATRVFQALRIAVNDELGVLRKVLPQAIEILAPEGRLAVISFHSLEDRIVKRFFKEKSGLKIITKKPIRPSLEEVEENARSRSAKLRVAEKL